MEGLYKNINKAYREALKVKYLNCKITNREMNLDFSVFRNVEEIYIKSDQLEIVPESFKYCEKLKKLSIQSKNINQESS